MKEMEETTVIIDFKEYPELLEKLKSEAKDDLRSQMAQVLFILRERYA